MNSKAQAKPKRHKKRKSRTQVSSDSDSDYSIAKSPSPPRISPSNLSKLDRPSEKSTEHKTIISKQHEIDAAFTKFYMQQATTEFAEDLDKLRQASDFKDDALPILIEALQQGTGMWDAEERRRVVLAGKEGG
ncbi:ribosome-assembly protein 3-domain-containing protein [Tricladium varicosporioides]|nr:ribosome-assembly protein 3-domain-containing protein [Hymenoscyphus varicosporioides]